MAYQEPGIRHGKSRVCSWPFDGAICLWVFESNVLRYHGLSSRAILQLQMGAHSIYYDDVSGMYLEWSRSLRPSIAVGCLDVIRGGFRLLLRSVLQVTRCWEARQGKLI